MRGTDTSAREERQREALKRTALYKVLVKYGGTTPTTVREFNLTCEANSLKAGITPAQSVHGEDWKRLLSQFGREAKACGLELPASLLVIPAEFDEAYKKPVYLAKPLPEGEATLYKSVKTFNGIVSTAPFAGVKEDRTNELIDGFFATLEGFKHLFIK
jgi:hypothetical protein